VKAAVDVGLCEGNGVAVEVLGGGGLIGSSPGRLIPENSLLGSPRMISKASRAPSVELAMLKAPNESLTGVGIGNPTGAVTPVVNVCVSACSLGRMKVRSSDEPTNKERMIATRIARHLRCVTQSSDFSSAIFTRALDMRIARSPAYSVYAWENFCAGVTPATCHRTPYR